MSWWDCLEYFWALFHWLQCTPNPTWNFRLLSLGLEHHYVYLNNSFRQWTSQLGSDQLLLPCVVDTSYNLFSMVHSGMGCKRCYYNGFCRHPRVRVAQYILDVYSVYLMSHVSIDFKTNAFIFKVFDAEILYSLEINLEDNEKSMIYVNLLWNASKQLASNFYENSGMITIRTKDFCSQYIKLPLKRTTREFQIKSSIEMYIDVL